MTTKPGILFEAFRIVSSRRTHVEYDLEIFVISTTKGSYKEKLDSFCRYGCLRRATARTHITVVLNTDDAFYADTVLTQIDKRHDVDVVIPSDSGLCFKTSAYLLYLLETGFVKARWYMAVDDDSVTDCDNLIQDLDSQFSSEDPFVLESCLRDVLATTPALAEEYSLCQRLQIPGLRIGWEARVLSRDTLEYIKRSEQARSVLVDSLTTGYFSDIRWTIAAAVAGVFPREYARLTPYPDMANFSAYGGCRNHIHGVNWADPLFKSLLDAYQYGSVRPITADVVACVMSKELVFGRGVGEFLCTVVLEPGGFVKGAAHENEETWTFDQTLCFRRTNKHNTTIFTQAIKTIDNRLVFLGTFLGATSKPPHFLYTKDPVLL